MLLIGFMGSAEVSLAALKILLTITEPKLKITTVWTNPPCFSGRNRNTPSPTAVAKYLGTLSSPPTLITTAKIGVTEIDYLKVHTPDAIVVAAFGQILPAAWLTIPPLGCYNLHFSLLPKYRGASPIQSAILAGEHTTGITLQKVVRKLDAGDIVLSDTFSLLKPAPANLSTPAPANLSTPERLPIPFALSAPEAFSESMRHSEVLLPRLMRLLTTAKTTGKPVPATPQSEIKDQHGNTIPPSYCRKLAKTDGLIPRLNNDLEENHETQKTKQSSPESARQIYHRYLALDPWPGLYFVHERIAYTITGLSPLTLSDFTSLTSLAFPITDTLKNDSEQEEQPEIYLFVATVKTTKCLFLWAKTNPIPSAEDVLEITSLKKAGKNTLATKDFLNGCRWKFPLRLLNNI